MSPTILKSVPFATQHGTYHAVLVSYTDIVHGWIVAAQIYQTDSGNRCLIEEQGCSGERDALEALNEMVNRMLSEEAAA